MWSPLRRRPGLPGLRSVLRWGDAPLFLTNLQRLHSVVPPQSVLLRFGNTECDQGVPHLWGVGGNSINLNEGRKSKQEGLGGICYTSASVWPQTHKSFIVRKQPEPELVDLFWVHGSINAQRNNSWRVIVECVSCFHVIKSRLQLTENTWI